MDWTEIITSILTALAASGGIGGIFYYSINKKLKHLEVQDKEVDVIKKQDDEWQELYYEQRDRVKEAREECKRLRDIKEAANEKAIKLEL